MKYGRHIWTVARVLFGLFFIYAPIMVIVKFGGQNPPETVPAASHFVQALDQTGFMTPSLIAVMIGAGLTILFDRTAPVGLILLGAPVFTIAGFHWFLTHNYVWGSIWPVWFALLAWHYRDRFARLVELRPSGPSPEPPAS